MARRRSGLGRGLSALIPDTPAESVATREIPTTEVETARIIPNPQQPRLRIDPAELEELTASVRVHGIIQPLLVTEVPGDGGPVYQLIAGERRWRAAQAAGLERVPVTIRQTTPQELLELALIENVQRADLDPIEEALAYQRLSDDFGLTQRDISDRVGRSRTAVANTMRLVDLSEEMRASLARDEISEGHARALLGLEDEHQRHLAWRRIVDEGLNVREAERMVRAWNAPPEATPAAPEPNADTDAMADMLRRSLGTKVTLRRGRGGSGSVTLHFFSDEELDGLLDRLLGQDRLGD